MVGHGPGQRVKMMSATQTLPCRLASETGSLFWVGSVKSEICPMTGNGLPACNFDQANAPAMTAMIKTNPPQTSTSIFCAGLFNFNHGWTGTNTDGEIQFDYPCASVLIRGKKSCLPKSHSRTGV